MAILSDTAILRIHSILHDNLRVLVYASALFFDEGEARDPDQRESVARGAGVRETTNDKLRHLALLLSNKMWKTIDKLV